MDGVELEFQEDSLRVAAKEALARKTGARGLRSICEKLLIDLMYEAPSIKGKKKFTVTKEIVQSGKVPATEALLLGSKQTA